MKVADFLSATTGWTEAPTPRSGIYILVVGDEIVYVGSTRNIVSRIGSHANRHDFDRAFWIEMPHERAHVIEGALIRALNPAWCKTCPNPRGESDIELLHGFGIEPDTRGAFLRRVRRHYKRVGDDWRKKRKVQQGEITARRAASAARVQAFIEAAS
jgi:hypothetical protein